MKFLIAFALLISCALASVDWSLYNCASVAALGPNSLSCDDWNIIPHSNTNPLSSCVSQTTSCALLNMCTFGNNLSNDLTHNCVSGSQTNLGGKTTGSTTGTTGARP